MAGIEYGALIGYSPNQGPGVPTNETFPYFKAGIDDAVSRGIRWIRMGPSEFIVDGTHSTPDTLVWNTAYLALMDDAFNYAISKGLRIDFFMPIPITWTSGYNQTDLLKVVDNYAGGLAQYFAGRAALWTVDNEGNTGDYRGPVTLGWGRSTTTSAYRSELATVIARARTAIHLWDPAPVTHDVASSLGGAIDDTAYAALTAFLDTVAPSLDALALHNYTVVLATTAINTLSGYLTNLQHRYNLPLYITEFGAFSYAAGQPTYTEQLQADSIAAMMRAFQQASPQPIAVILYRYKDPTVPLLNPLKGSPVILTDAGLYASPPTGVTFTGGTGAGALGGGTATITTAYNGSTGYIVTGVTLTNGGMYASIPTVTFTGGTIGAGHAATATAILDSEYLGIENADGTPKLGFPVFFATMVPISTVQQYRPYARPYLVLLDANGNRPAQINGINMDSALRGITNLRYTPEGAVLDKLGSIAFDAPATAPINRAITPGTQVQVYDPTVLGYNNAPTVVAWGIYRTGSRTLNRSGTIATFTFDDLLQELAQRAATTGFATAADATGAATEGTTAILRRLVYLNVDTTWAVTNDVTGLDGLAFSAMGASIFGAATKLASERFAHVKRGVARTLKFGRFGDTSGITFRKATGSPTAAASDLTTRQIPDGGLKSSMDGTIVNDIVPLGGDTGVLQVSLQPLYNATGEVNLGAFYPNFIGWYLSGPASFTGYDPAYPIYRRPRADGGGIDGYEYLIADSASVNAYGRHQAPFVKSDIVPVKNAAGGVSPADRVAAATVLYQVGVSFLKWNAQPHEQIAITVPASGDLRDIAGKTATVWYTDTTQGLTYDGTQQWVVMEVSRAVANQPMDTFTLSSSGTYAQEPAAVFNGLVTGLTNLQLNPTATRVPYTVSKADNCDAGFPIAVTVRGNTGVQGILTARAWLTPSALRSEATPQTHYHEIQPIAHDVNAVHHDVVALAVPIRSGGVPVTVYNPKTKIHIAGGTPPSSAKVLMYHESSETFYFQTGGSTTDAPTSSQELTLDAATTTATTGGTGGATQATANGKGGTTQSVTDSNKLDPKAGMKLAMVANGPVPTGLTLWIDGVQVAGPVNGPLTIDLSTYFAANPQADHTVEGRCATLGHLDIEVVVERYQSSIGR
jgi:Glycosyl hydrolase catalytic core